MAIDRRMNAAFSRPGWASEADTDSGDTLMRHRRWRIMESLLPFDSTLDPLPAWVRTPEQFVGWMSCRIDTAGLKSYFREIQAVAKQTCDLELLRFARKYLSDF
ncbi:MAG: hypothetical protein ABSG66_07615 [Stellaceae bacterium]|jgi:hypothetical protein